MKRALVVTDADRLLKFLEKDIEEHGNPTTPEMWSQVMDRFLAIDGMADEVIPVPDNVTSADLYREMKKNGIDVELA